MGDDRAVGLPGVGRSRRPALRRATWAAVVASSALVLFECAVEQKTLGASCVKGEDCLSGFCSDQICVAAPPLLDGEPPLVDGSSEAHGEAAGDSPLPKPEPTPEASDDGSTEAANDAKMPPEAAADHASIDGKAEHKDASGSVG